MSVLNRELEENGYFILRGAVQSSAIDTLHADFLSLLKKESNGDIDTINVSDDHILEYFNNHPSFLPHIYDKIREFPYLENFVKSCGITDGIKKIHTEGSSLLSKIVLRMDRPQELKELAVWHQDHYYVKGNTNILTAWVPLQDVNFLNGCLSVMPKSHRLGPLEHNVNVLKKKYYPSDIFKNEFKYVELKKGDALVFHSLLLHSSNINLSDKVRYSIQARFSPTNMKTDPEMGNLISI